jgi:hypothetical protein
MSRPASGTLLPRITASTKPPGVASNHAPVRNVIAGLIADRAAATCVTVDPEAGYSGRDLNDVRAIAQRRRRLYVVLPFSEVIADRARDAGPSPVS